MDRARLAPWLDANTTPLVRAIVERALTDVGIVEMPPGSNRSERIDEYVLATGSPVGSRWCAAALGAWWRDAGATVPSRDAGSCSAWLAWSRVRGTLTQRAAAGSAVVYGTNGVASHIGVIVRALPLILSVEGNTSLAGAFDPAGIAVALKETNIARVLGYITPAAADSKPTDNEGE